LDTVTICNGSECIIVVFQAGQFILGTGKFKDTGAGYKNANITKLSGFIRSDSVSFDVDNFLTAWSARWRYSIVTVGPITKADSNERVANDFSDNYDYSFSNSNFEGGSEYGGGGWCRDCGRTPNDMF
jgi:hypothetical protein